MGLLTCLLCQKIILFDKRITTKNKLNISFFSLSGFFLILFVVVPGWFVQCTILSIILLEFFYFVLVWFGLYLSLVIYNL